MRISKNQYHLTKAVSGIIRSLLTSKALI